MLNVTHGYHKNIIMESVFAEGAQVGFDEREPAFCTVSALWPLLSHSAD